MKIIEFEQPEKLMELYFLGDTHYPRGKRNKFLEVLEKIKNKSSAYMVGLGDFCECITASDPRYNPEEMAKIIEEYTKAMNMINKQWDLFEDDIKPLADDNKIITLHCGNHGSSYTKHTSFNALDGICRRNNIEYAGDGMAILDISYKDKHTQIQTFHGHGGGNSIGYTYKRLSDYSNIVSDVNAVAAGHSHRLGINIAILPLKLKNGELKQRIQYHCSCGSFLGNYDTEVSSYAERKAYPPLPIGYVKMEIYKGEIVRDSVVAVPV